ncbi:MAG: YfhO family protein [Candidatus Hydrogenedentota bacterium]
MNRDIHQISWRELLLHALLLVVILVCLFPATFLNGERTVPGGLLYERIPWKHYQPADLEPIKNKITYEYLLHFAKFHAVEHMAHEFSEWPLWNPLELTGTPLLANYQSAVFFPLRFPHWFLDQFLADTIFLLLRLWLCGFTAYLCARGFGLETGPSRFFSLAWMASGVCITWFYWPEPQIMAFLPLVLLGAEYLLMKQYRRGFATLTVGGILILLAGHPETAFLGCLGIGGYFVLRLAMQRPSGRHLRRSLALGAAAWFIALLVCAPQILPFLEYVRNSNISVTSYEHTISKYSGLPLQTLVCVIVPRFFGVSADGNFWLDEADNSNTTTYLYIGAVTWAAITLLFARGKYSSRMRAQVIGLTAPAVVGGFLALRSHPLEALNQLAIWKYWYITFTLFALPLLGALGIQHWVSIRRTLRDITFPAVVVVAPFLFVAGLFFFHRHVLALKAMDGYVLRQIVCAAGFAGVGLAIAAAACFRAPARTITGLLALVLAVDMVFAARDLLPTSPDAHLYPETRLTSELQALGHPTRISVITGGIDTGLFQHYRIEQLHGYEPIYPRRVLEYLEQTYPKAWTQAERLCSLDYYLFPHRGEAQSAAPATMERVATADGIDIFRNPAALPRAFLVPSLETVPDSGALFQRMQDKAFDPTKVALTAAPIEPFTAETASVHAGNAHIDAWTPTKIGVKVDPATRCVLVLTDAFYPGWKAYRDGVKTKVFPVYHNFRGIIVEPGSSRVEFCFEPTSLGVGLWASSVSMLFMLLWAVWTLVRRRSIAPESRR